MAETSKAPRQLGGDGKVLEGDDGEPDGNTPNPETGVVIP
jgi:hypothetical protein